MLEALSQQTPFFLRAHGEGKFRWQRLSSCKNYNRSSLCFHHTLNINKTTIDLGFFFSLGLYLGLKSSDPVCVLCCLPVILILSWLLHLGWKEPTSFLQRSLEPRKNQREMVECKLLTLQPCCNYTTEQRKKDCAGLWFSFTQRGQCLVSLSDGPQSLLNQTQICSGCGFMSVCSVHAHAPWCVWVVLLYLPRSPPHISHQDS